MTDEIFGPVLSVYRVNSFDDALQIENGNDYGNAAAIYTSNGAYAEYFQSRFRAGMIGVNIGIPVPREPFSFGGMYGTKSKYGDMDITGDGCVEFFSTRRKITSKWSTTINPGDTANFSGQL
ncbi:Methylmalonate-semialdehyde dehydrogenase (acylating) [Phytophthora palmivora]|uniref:Methylmalonate-semialdehyde dehydrogenase (Acylating) n=1 Tax=Phytophthora palmivora TaxID=4796 RepID=A0A2P4YER1_9STRA|nr:Methylmalonate-semialdehyde dehydrogenase (acylating) [Phytophthora palmivora]